MEEARGRVGGRPFLFLADISISGKHIVCYFQEARVELAFRHLTRDAALSSVRYRLPGIVEKYLSALNFITCKIFAAVMWNTISIT
jgi:hypothetical protein